MKLQVSLTGAKEAREQLLRIGRSPALALAQTAEELEEVVEAQAGKHSKTGALVRSIYKRRQGEGWEIGHDLQVAPHALFVHWGTRPHPIYPKGASLSMQRSLAGKFGVPAGKKLVLRFPVGGRFVFARAVNHPGTKADPWLTRAAALAPSIFAKHVQALISKEASNAPA